jgi:hypothetical protein
MKHPFFFGFIYAWVAVGGSGGERSEPEDLLEHTPRQVPPLLVTGTDSSTIIHSSSILTPSGTTTPVPRVISFSREAPSPPSPSSVLFQLDPTKWRDRALIKPGEQG